MGLGHTTTLADGRTLGFDDVGDPSGVAVLYAHGSPDSRRARHPDDGLAPTLHIANSVPCFLAATAGLPETCDLIGATVAAGTTC